MQVSNGSRLITESRIFQVTEETKGYLWARRMLIVEGSVRCTAWRGTAFVHIGFKYQPQQLKPQACEPHSNPTHRFELKHAYLHSLSISTVLLTVLTFVATVSRTVLDCFSPQLHRLFHIFCSSVSRKKKLTNSRFKTFIRPRGAIVCAALAIKTTTGQ